MKTNNYKPYKIHISQRLVDGDQERRLNYCNWLNEQIALREDFLKCVIWSNECKFTNCGTFNRNNEHFWAEENPHLNHQIRNQVRFSLNVWAGILNDRIIGPLIYQENLTGVGYLNILQNELRNHLEDIPLARLPFLWFQQDGAPPHNFREVREFLNEEFPQQ